MPIRDEIMKRTAKKEPEYVLDVTKERVDNYFETGHTKSQDGHNKSIHEAIWAMENPVIAARRLYK